MHKSSYSRKWLRQGAAILGYILCTVNASAAVEFARYADVKPILDSLAPQLAGEAKWEAWARQQDQAIRARLEQGDLDSMVNLLLFGVSFTRQPRIPIETMTDAAKSGVLRSRTRDLVRALQSPGGNERLLFLRNLLLAKGVNPDSSEAGVFALQNLERVLKELRLYSQRADRSSVFHDRGISLDTSVLPDFGIEQALRDIKDRGLLAVGQVSRAAVIGPGLDFTDWDLGYDYYPQQMLQPLALYDSLARLGLLRRGGAPEVTVFDISPRVLDHLRRIRKRAAMAEGYVLQLPRDPARRWLPAAVDYWRELGSRTGTPVPPIRPPALLQGLASRAVRIRPSVVLACQPVDLNIVLEREPGSAGRFDLVVATNVFVYYSALEQGLALQNVVNMLKPGGVFLSNTELPRLPEAPIRSIGRTSVRYTQNAGDQIIWYQRL